MVKKSESSIDQFFKQEQWPLDFITSDKFSYFLNQIPESVFMSNEEGNIIQCNQNASRLTGYSNKELLSMTIEELVPPEYRDHHSSFREMFFRRPFSRLMGESRSKLQIYTKDNQSILFDAALFAIRTDKGVIAVNFMRDITDAWEERQRLMKKGSFDALTGLPNRYLLQEMFDKFYAKAKREQQNLVIILFDLDKFKPVNDNYGHQIGDELLKQLAKRLNDDLRADDFVARFGGDEFVLLSISKNFSKTLPEKLLKQFAKPFVIDSVSHQVGASIGVAIDSTYKFSLQDLLAKADSALYQSKHSGGNCFHIVQVLDDEKN